uniref:Uncharacterized protein n=1 Tax=Anguilla anguilla TaxID=7936 RepID=A0A0E9RE17_ANGAN
MRKQDIGLHKGKILIFKGRFQAWRKRNQRSLFRKKCVKLLGLNQRLKTKRLISVLIWLNSREDTGIQNSS